MLNTSSVNANGVDVTATFSSAVTSVEISEFLLVADGTPVELLSVTGSGTDTLTFRVSKSWIQELVLVRLSYFGASLTSSGVPVAKASVAATNNSTIKKNQIEYVGRKWGIFIHITSLSYGIGYSGPSADINQFNPYALNVDQMLDGALLAGFKYVAITCKHDAGFCIWPTNTTVQSIKYTSWYATTPIDIVGDFVKKCRARGIPIVLYINFYDPWYRQMRPGNTNTYAGAQEYFKDQLTELLTWYGQIDCIWIDSIGYNTDISTYVSYDDIRSHIASLQPNCLVANNDRGSTEDSDIAVYEGSGAPDSPPALSNIIPCEYVETSNSNNVWEWNAANDSNIRPALELVKQLKEVNQARGSYMINFSPNLSGAFTSPQINLLYELGSIIGKRGLTGTS